MSQIRDQVREYDTITVTPCTPHIGAEIGNIDLTRTLSNRQVEEVHDAIIAHGVIFFRNQKIDFESHEASGALFRRTARSCRRQGHRIENHSRPSGDPKAIFRRQFKTRFRRGMAFRPELRRNPADVQRALSGDHSAERRRRHHVRLRLQGLRRTQSVDEDLSRGQDRDA